MLAPTAQEGNGGVPEVIKATLPELSPSTIKRLGELLDSDDERIQLEAVRTILDRCLGRPAIQADVTVNGNLAVEHLHALIEVAQNRRAETIDLDEREVSHVTPCRLGREWYFSQNKAA